jgi:hypothetical protein
MLTQTIWLWLRSRREERLVQERDNSLIFFTPLESTVH